MIIDRVYTIEEYYDAPRKGVTGYQNKPHVYECQFSRSEDYWTDLFLLMEIDNELFELVLESWGIFLRWAAAFRLGEASLESHPALPEERARYSELQNAIGNRLRLVPERSVTRRARFVRGAGEVIQVEWTIPEEYL